jgi:glutamate-ammonia-ligase adenylyltransferase
MPVPSEKLTVVRKLIEAGTFGEEEGRLLKSLGFSDPKRAWTNIASLRETLARADKSGEFLPVFVADLLESFDADLGLNSAERLAEALEEAEDLIALGAEDTWSRRALVACLSGSPYLTEMLISDPVLLQEVFASGVLRRSVFKDDLEEELAGLLEGVEAREAAMKVLRRFRRRAFLRIGLRDLLREAELTETVEDLSNLADVSLEAGLRLAKRFLAARFGKPRHVDADGIEQPGEFCVLGMGKLGGQELNFSSDIDLMYVYDFQQGTTTGVQEPSGRVVGKVGLHEYYTRLAQELTRLIGERTADEVVFRVDLGLRPEGKSGDICSNLRTYELYYESWGETWERQALLKARPVAGSRRLGESFISTIKPFVFRKYLDFDAIQEIRGMKERIDRRLGITAPKGGRHVKLGAGGIREVEFIIQAFQMLYAGRDTWLRERNSLRALHRLSDRGHITFAEYSDLSKAYIFLRELENRIQMTYGLQAHTIPEDKPSQASLARKMGLAGETPRELASALLEAYDGHTSKVRAVYNKFFYTADVEEAAHPVEEFGWIFDPELRGEALKRLEALGFAHPNRAANDFLLLHDGPPARHPSARSKLLFRSLVPPLLEGLKEVADPDGALRHLEEFVTASGAREMHFSLLLENPSLLEHLLALLGHSEFLSHILIMQPNLFNTLVDPSTITEPVSARAFERDLFRALEAMESTEERIEELRRLKKAAELRIGLRHLWGECDLKEALKELSVVAESCLRWAFSVAEEEARTAFGQPRDGRDGRGRPATFSVIGLGKLGGQELDFGSDLDVMFVFSADGATDGRGTTGEAATNSAFFSRVAERLIHILSSVTQSGYAYRVDAGLRPEGSKSPLVHSLDGLEAYYPERGQLWERQAMLRARAVAGGEELGEAVIKLLKDFAYGRPIGPEDILAMDAMRRRMEKERGREGPTRKNFKLGRGGLADVEFVCQILQLSYGAERPEIRTPNTFDGLVKLSTAGFIEPAEGVALAEAYGFLRQVEKQLRVERERSVDTLPAAEEKLSTLARRMGLKDRSPVGLAQAFLQEYERLTGVVRQLYERIVEREASAR